MTRRREVTQRKGTDDSDAGKASRSGDSACERTAAVRMAAAVAVWSVSSRIAALGELGLGGGVAAEEHGTWHGMRTSLGPRMAAAGGISRRGGSFRIVVRQIRQGILAAPGAPAHPDA